MKTADIGLGGLTAAILSLVCPFFLAVLIVVWFANHGTVASTTKP